MRCYSCNKDIGDSSPPDRPTGRYYCSDCFTPTLEVQLAAASIDGSWDQFNTSKYSESFYDLESAVDVIPEALPSEINEHLEQE